MFLLPLVVCLGVKFGFRKSCQCKRFDKYELYFSGSRGGIGIFKGTRVNRGDTEEQELIC